MNNSNAEARPMKATVARASGVARASITAATSRRNATRTTVSSARRTPTSVTPTTLQARRVASGFEANLSKTVSSSMVLPSPPLYFYITYILLQTSIQILGFLTAHGCINITSSINWSSCSKNPVAAGGLGDIFIGRLRTGKRIAIKVFRCYGESNELTGKYQKRAAREIHTWSKCRNPNVVELIGLTVFRECLAMVSEWEDNGNMTQYLSHNPAVNRCELSKSICAGMSYLHSMDIVHGDLKGANVLIDRNGAAKLTDFGCASLLSATLHFTQTNTGPSYSVRWAAPEILRGKTGHTKEGDVYALGMTILEAFTAEVPFSGRSEISLYRHVVDGKQAPSRPGSIIPERSVLGNVLWALLMSCWSYNPEGRPSAQAVHKLMLPLSAELLKEIAERPDDEDDEGLVALTHPQEEP